MHPATPKSFRIAKDDLGQTRLTVRETRFNSQGYPLVTEVLEEECFKNTASARAFAAEHYGAKVGQFTTK